MHGEQYQLRLRNAPHNPERSTISLLSRIAIQPARIPTVQLALCARRRIADIRTGLRCYQRIKMMLVVRSTVQIHFRKGDIKIAWRQALTRLTVELQKEKAYYEIDKLSVFTADPDAVYLPDVIHGSEEGNAAGQAKVHQPKKSAFRRSACKCRWRTTPLNCPEMF